MKPEILQGIAQALFESAWANHSLQHDCNATLDPPAPAPYAYEAAAEVLRNVERLNGLPITAIYEQASEACAQATCDHASHTPEHFGRSIGLAALASTVSWSDAHAAMGEPMVENAGASDLAFNLELAAGDRCRNHSRTTRKRCECGVYRLPKTPCHNCEAT